ncbi:unnamed protein product [Cuscuta campestris]|uniref:CCHC-type domain-containing protein n=1 Tax=Cuscuta campestris TaxID=132261 RepID=A0A484L5R5_9ASTE|nr:unnamed protein product [Cuscuta campestris]
MPPSDGKIFPSIFPSLGKQSLSETDFQNHAKSNGKLYPSLFKPWSNIITRQNALTQRWETYPIDGNPAMISCCSTAKEMWDKLEVTYEGTDQVREAKIDFLTQEYEMFRMKEHEKIDDMFDRFSKIVNDLHALKKTYTDRDLVRKILRSLTSEWRSKADAIYESIGTSNVTIDSLRGNLKTYESTILNPSLNDQRKCIALKASKEPTMNDSSDEDEVKLIMKKFCKLLKKEKAEDGPVRYGCGEAGHIKNKCPRNGRNARHFKKQRAYISWGGDSGNESSEQEEDEEANLCLIAQEEEESANDENQEGSLFPLVVRRKGIFLRVEVLECGISEQVLLRLVGLEFSGCNGLLSTRKLNGSSVARESLSGDWISHTLW